MLKIMEKSKEKKMRECLHSLREELIFKLLTNNKIDLNEFINSRLYNNPNNYYLIEHIYGKIDGYDYCIVMKYDDKSQSLLTVEENDSNNHEMEIKKARFSFSNDTLTLSDDEVSYTYEVDEHCRYYVNGEELKLGRIIKSDTEKKQLMKKTKEYVKRIWVK